MMTPRGFEKYITLVLSQNGYWAHRISPNEAGQQPFDVIALKKGVVCAYDAKVLSEGHLFPMNRVEDNQINAFSVFRRKVGSLEIGCLIYTENGIIRFLSYDEIEYALRRGKKSIDVRELPLWKVI